MKTASGPAMGATSGMGATRGIGRAALALLLAASCLAPSMAQAGKMHKCVVKGKVAYQDKPCPLDAGSTEEDLQRQARIKAQEHKLDLLQAKGQGMVQAQPPDGDRAVPSGAASPAALEHLIELARQACNGNLERYPAVGMRDEFFRNCTIHARFGGASQVVAAQDGNVPLRLYVFPTQRASRVYTVDGVITTILP